MHQKKHKITEEELAKAIRKVSPEMPKSYVSRLEQTLQKIVDDESRSGETTRVNHIERRH